MYFFCLRSSKVLQFSISPGMGKRDVDVKTSAPALLQNVQGFPGYSFPFLSHFPRNIRN
jgi:hypothetical protein